MAFHAVRTSSVNPAPTQTALFVQHSCVSQHQRQRPFTLPCPKRSPGPLRSRHGAVRHSKVKIQCCLPSTPSDRQLPLDHNQAIPADKATPDARTQSCGTASQASNADQSTPQAQDSIPFHRHLFKKVLVAAGAMLLLYLLFSSLSRQLHTARAFIADSPPAAVWLPYPQAIQQQQAALQQHWLAAANFASSSITATSSRMLRVPDAAVAQFTAVLQQVGELLCTTHRQLSSCRMRECYFCKVENTCSTAAVTNSLRNQLLLDAAFATRIAMELGM